MAKKLDMGAAVTAALALAQRNWSVLPLRGKVPRLHNGLHGATTDPHAIRNWWEMWPDSNIGVRTGLNIVVLDVDGDEGADSLHNLEQRHGKLPQWTVSAVTGGGGMHYYFGAQGIPNSAGKLGPGLDVRGDNGYVVVPPSVHPDTGRVYEWDNDPHDTPIQPMPAWLYNLLYVPLAQRRKRTPTREWVRMLDRIPEGERNDSLARLTGLLFSRDLDDAIVARLVLSVNTTACKPPLPADEVIRIIESILRRHLRSVAA
jgi:hypothetical protein